MFFECVIFLNMPYILKLLEVLELLLRRPLLEILYLLSITIIERVHDLLRVPAAQHESTLRIPIIPQQILRVFFHTFHLIRSRASTPLLNASHGTTVLPVPHAIVSTCIAQIIRTTKQISIARGMRTILAAEFILQFTKICILIAFDNSAFPERFRHTVDLLDEQLRLEQRCFQRLLEQLILMQQSSLRFF